MWEYYGSGFRDLGFRGLGFRGLRVKGLGFRVYRDHSCRGSIEASRGI